MTTYYINNSFEAHTSNSFGNAVKFATKMAKQQKEEIVRISWDKHNMAFTESYLWNDSINDIAPCYL